MKKYREAILYAVFIIIGFVFAVTKAYPQIAKIYHVEKDIQTKTIQAEDLDRKLDALKKAELEKKSLVGQAKNIYKPEVAADDAETSFTVIFDDIIDMAKYNGIKIYSVEYVYNPSDDEFIKGAAAKYNVCLLNMQVIADYQDLESFLKEIYKYPYLLNVSKLELTPYPKNKKILMTGLQLKLYSAK